MSKTLSAPACGLAPIANRAAPAARWLSRSRRLAVAALATLAVLAGTGGPTYARTTPDTAPSYVAVPMPAEGLFSHATEMTALVYKPPGPGPFPVVVYSHGRAGNPSVRAKLKWPVSNIQVAYWLERNVAVVAPIRVGYGATGGPDVESNGSRFGNDGVCRNADFSRPSGAGSAAILATLAWVRQQPWADAHRMILEGQSVGGLATVTAAATRPEGVLGYINFGGGAGGNPDRSPGVSCEPQALGHLYRELGKTTTMPNLWVYAQNDQYWGPDEPVRWHQAFAQGGSPSQFVHAPAVADGDGHGLNHHDRELWAPYMDAFLKPLGL